MRTSSHQVFSGTNFGDQSINTAVQRYLERLEEWADRPLMKSIKDQCKGLHRGGKKTLAVIQAGHQPAGEQLCWKSTGGPVWQQSWTWACRISWQHRWPAATWVVRTGAWLVPWGKQLPTSYSRAHQDHCVWLCSPPLQTPRTRKTLITLTHERAARLVKGQEHMHCAERLRAVGLLSLQKGRSGGGSNSSLPTPGGLFTVVSGGKMRDNGPD